MTTRLRSKMVKGKKQYSCVGCTRNIMPGELSQVNVYVVEGQIQQYRLCLACESLIAKHHKYLIDGENFEKGFIKEWMRELGIKTHSEFAKYLDEKNLHPIGR